MGAALAVPAPAARAVSLEDLADPYNGGAADVIYMHAVSFVQSLEDLADPYNGRAADRALALRADCLGACGAHALVPARHQDVRVHSVEAHDALALQDAVEGAMGRWWAWRRRWRPAGCRNGRGLLRTRHLVGNK